MYKVLSKLAWRNAKRSIKDYIIYLITVTLAFSFIFSFNLIVFSDDILNLSNIMINFRYAIIFVSLIVLVVIGWLINYTARFIFTKRSKEFGTYILLGIEKKSISKLFLLENLLLGVLALLLSFGIGFIFQQFMTVIIMNIFELPYQVNFSFSFQAIALTILYFGIIYLFILFRSNHRIKKMKIHDLLYFERQNEKLSKNKKHRNIIFIISLFLGIIGISILYYFFTLENIENGAMSAILISFILLIISIYGIALTFCDFVSNLILNNKKLKYKQDNLFIIRQFSSKVKSMGFTIGTLSLLVTLTFLSLNLSNIFNSIFNQQASSIAPYDISIYNLFEEENGFVHNEEYKEDVLNYIDFIKQYYTITDKLVYNVYTDNNNPIRKYISDGTLGYQEVDTYIRVSDYNKLLTMKGENPITLHDDEYFIHSFRDVSEEIKKYLKNNHSITINHHVLKSTDFTDKNYSSSWSRGSSYIIIVPDMVVENLEVLNTTLNINTKEKTTEEFEKLLSQKIEPYFHQEIGPDGEIIYYTVANATVKGSIEAENKSFITILSFSFLYMAFIFTAVVGTILSIQSLSDSTKYKYRYSILSKLGLEEKQIYKTIRKQLQLYFLLPIVYPIVISLAVSGSLNQLFGIFLASDSTIYFYSIMNFGIFFIIYFIYYIATYFGFKNNVCL